jgi:hypothetical protein
MEKVMIAKSRNLNSSKIKEAIVENGYKVKGGIS